jgi:hypothetical protein
MPCCPPCHQDVARSARHRLSLSLSGARCPSRVLPRLSSLAAAAFIPLHRSAAPARWLVLVLPGQVPPTAVAARAGAPTLSRAAAPWPPSGAAPPTGTRSCRVTPAVSWLRAGRPRHLLPELVAARRAAASPQRCRPRHLFIFIETRSVPCPLLKFMIVISHLYESEKKRAPVLILYFGHSPTLEIYIK